MAPKDFFNNHVRKNYDFWLEAPLEEWRAKNATHAANVMAERYFGHWHVIDRAKVNAARDVAEFRDFLAARCADFAIVRDIDDAHKHITLSRPNRRLTNSDQTAPGSLGWGEGAWGEGVWGGTEQLIVQLDDGTKRPLTAIMKNVVQMWEAILGS